MHPLAFVPGPEHLLPALQAIAAERIGCPVIPFKDLAVKRKIGDGSIGQVYLGKWQETDVAVKVSGLACHAVVNPAWHISASTTGSDVIQCLPGSACPVNYLQPCECFKLPCCTDCHAVALKLAPV